MADRKRTLKWGGGAAAAVLTAGIAFGDDAGRLLRSAPDRPPAVASPRPHLAPSNGRPLTPTPPGRGWPPSNGRPLTPIPPADGVGQQGRVAYVKSRLDAFVVMVSESGTEAREAAIRAGDSVACNVLLIAVTKERLPTWAEWVDIGVDAAAGAATSGLHIPVGSQAWRSLEQVKDGVSDAIKDESGLVDEGEAESLAEELGCALT
jgi:hypothetical protein